MSIEKPEEPQTMMHHLKEASKIEEKRVREQLSKLSETFFKYTPEKYFITPSQFTELKPFIQDLDGKVLEDDYDNIGKFICEHCRPRIPSVEIPSDCGFSGGSYLIVPSHSKITFWLTTDIYKSAIFREIRRFYNHALELSEDSESIHAPSPRKLFLVNDVSFLVGLMREGLSKKEKQIKIKKRDPNFVSHVCKTCETDGVIEKMLADTKNDLETYYKKFGLNPTDYHYNIRVQKEVKWDPEAKSQ